MQTLKFHANEVQINGYSWKTPFSIRDACLAGDRVVIIYSPYERPEPQGKFHNMEAFSVEGEKLWTAEHPRPKDPNDVYLRFFSSEPLIAGNFACLKCTLDAATGKILEAQVAR
jgi:hypothetical protein